MSWLTENVTEDGQLNVLTNRNTALYKQRIANLSTSSAAARLSWHYSPFLQMPIHPPTTYPGQPLPQSLRKYPIPPTYQEY